MATPTLGCPLAASPHSRWRRRPRPLPAEAPRSCQAQDGAGGRTLVPGCGQGGPCAAGSGSAGTSGCALWRPGGGRACPRMALGLLLLLLPLGGAATLEVTRPRGVALSNHHFYDPSKPFTCLDGSGSISFSWVNDDYCDCRDGSDEPGTPACPNGRFHCTNAGYKPHSIPSAHVNDGICDCCDGTDEYSSGAACNNTCRELGRREREALQRQAEVAREGFEVRQRLVREAAASREEKQGRLGALQEARRELELRAGSLRAAKEAAEAPEKAAVELHRRRWEEQQAAAQAQAEAAEAEEAFSQLDSNGDGRLTAEELRSHPQLSTQEEEAQVLLEEPVDPQGFKEKVWSSLKERLQGKDQASPPPPSLEPPLEETPPGGGEEEEEEEEEEEAEEEEAEEEGPEEELKVPPPHEKGAEETPPEPPPYDEATQALIDAAQRARGELEEAERALKETEDSIRALEQELAFDFGPQGEFSYLYNQCYELGTSEYLYRLCPFKRVSQKPKHGGAETNLGTWGSWAGPEQDRFSAMKYEHGTGCWQGPNRATTVRLSCGRDTVLKATSEPSRCEYLMELETPAACSAPPRPGHDEL